jgi:hypothetical protein
MVALIWVGVFLALFYRWLCGGWFARVLMCMLLVVTFGVVGMSASGKMLGDNPVQLLFGIAGGFGGWMAGSLPTWYWRERNKSLVAAENRNTLMASSNHEVRPLPYYRY